MCCFISWQPGKLLPSAHAVEREYRVMKAIGPHGVPVPQTIVLCEDDRFVNIYKAVSECSVSGGLS